MVYLVSNLLLEGSGYCFFLFSSLRAKKLLVVVFNVLLNKCLRIGGNSKTFEPIVQELVKILWNSDLLCET